jgi:transposase
MIHRSALARYIHGSRLEMDTNAVERAIRPQTLPRKNATFAGSDGGCAWATIATLLATARLNDVDPQAWLTLTQGPIANSWPNKDLDTLLPWNYRPN